jgi:hypothetical protein
MMCGSESFDEVSQRLREIRDALKVIEEKVASGRPLTPEDLECLRAQRTQLKKS